MPDEIGDRIRAYITSELVGPHGYVASKLFGGADYEKGDRVRVDNHRLDDELDDEVGEVQGAYRPRGLRKNRMGYHVRIDGGIKKVWGEDLEELEEDAVTDLLDEPSGTGVDS